VFEYFTTPIVEKKKTNEDGGVPSKADDDESKDAFSKGNK
jgi:hypothetical protein